MSLVLRNPIGWCDVTGNAVIGCEKVSLGCAGCYAENDTPARVLRFRGIETWGPKGTRVPIAGFAAKARRLNRFCICEKCRHVAPYFLLGTPCQHREEHGTTCRGKLRRIRFFSDSNGDWLDEKWPLSSLVTLLQTVHECPNLDFQLLTKRPENFLPRMGDAYAEGFMAEGHSERNAWMEAWRDGTPPSNVWVGVSVENQPAMEQRGPLVLAIPAVVRFLSCEPLLGPVNVGGFILSDIDKAGFDDQRIVTLDSSEEKVNWVIVGGESGSRARACNVEWLRDIVRDCNEYGAGCYVKQVGAMPVCQCSIDVQSFSANCCQHFPYPIRDKKGADPAEWPEDLRVRQFPEVRA